MFITGSQLLTIFVSAFFLLRGLVGPLSYFLTVTYIEGIKIIFVFNMAIFSARVICIKVNFYFFSAAFFNLPKT